MQTAGTLQQPAFSIPRLALLTALVVAFLLGSASGYLVKALGSSASPTQTQHATACPSGSHAVVWYTAQTWTCASN